MPSAMPSLAIWISPGHFIPAAVPRHPAACRGSLICYSSQCWCRASSTEVQSLSPLPRAWPEGRSRASGGTRTRTRPFTGGVLVPSSCTGIRGWPAGVEPAQPRFTAGSRCRFEFGHSAPTWNRTRNSAFAGPRDVPFTIEATNSTPARNRTWASTFGESRDVRFTTRAANVSDQGGS